MVGFGAHRWYTRNGYTWSNVLKNWLCLCGGDPVVKQGTVPTHQSYWKFLEEAVDLNWFLFAVLSSFGTAQLSHFTDCTFVPSTQGLDGGGDEGDADAVALLPGLVQLSVVGNCQGMARGVGSQALYWSPKFGTWSQMGPKSKFGPKKVPILQASPKFRVLKVFFWVF